MGATKVDGNDKGKVRIFTLSTCIWCKKTKEFLAQNNVAYEYVDMDKLDSEEKDAALAELKKWNEKCSMPTVVVNDSVCIVGFKEQEIREALSL